MLEVILLVVAVCIGWLIWLIAQQSKPRREPISAARKPSKAGNPPTPEIKQKLNRLVYGDREMAERLLKQARLRHPRKPEQWIWEKVVEDLERDRGYR